MVTCLLITGLLMQQQNSEPPLPDNTKIVHSGIPRAGAGSQNVRMVTHSATSTLTHETIAVETVTQFKNNSDQEVRMTIEVPLIGMNVSPFDGFGAFKVRMNWDKGSQSFSRGPVRSAPFGRLEDENIQHVSALRANVTFKPRATHALRMNYELPVGQGGLGDKLFVVAYETSGAGTWAGALDSLKYSIRYTSDVVLQVDAARPRWGWQIGQRGAFVERRDYAPSGDSLLTFSYYRNEPRGITRGGG